MNESTYISCCGYSLGRVYIIDNRMYYVSPDNSEPVEIENGYTIICWHCGKKYILNIEKSKIKVITKADS